MEKITLEESKQYQIGILSSIDAFCRSHDINYSIAYGTLLGAARHRGFIPWDDDIDIVMLRKDYDRFVENYSDEHYRLVRGENIANHLHVVVTDPSTVVKFDEGTTDALFYKGGVWVDVFPLDNVPDDDGKYEKIKKKIYQRRFLQRYGEVSPVNKGDRVIKKFVKRIVHVFLALTKDYNGAKALKLMRTYNTTNTNKVANFAVWYLKNNQSIPSKWFDDYIELEFEGRRFRAIKNYIDYLVSLYGDWQKLPPHPSEYPGIIMKHIKYN